MLIQYHFYYVATQLCCLEFSSVNQNLILIHIGGWPNKFLSSISAYSHKQLVMVTKNDFQIIHLKQETFKVPPKEFSGWKFNSVFLLIDPNTSAGPGLVLGSTVHSKCLIDRVNQVDHGFSDLLGNLLMYVTMGCEVLTAVCAEASLQQGKGALFGLVSLSTSLCPIVNLNPLDWLMTWNENFEKCAELHSLSLTDEL